MLMNNEPLPKKCDNHQLTASGCLYQGFWDCHIRPNLVLIYSIDRRDDVLKVVRLGSHSDIGLTENLSE